MPLYEQFIMPTSQKISTYVGNPINAYASLAAEYQKKYDATLEAESDLSYMMDDAFNTTRRGDRDFLTSKLKESQEKLSGIQEEAAQNGGRGFTMPKITRAAKELASVLKPLQQAKVLEDQEISHLATLNLDSEQKKAREDYIRNKSSITQDEDGRLSFNYSPTLFKEQPNWQKLADEIASGTRPEIDQAWSNSGIYYLDNEGYIVDPASRQRVSNVKHDVNLGVGVPVEISRNGALQRVSADRIKEVTMQGLATNSDVSTFLSQEGMVSGMDVNQMFDKYVTPALEYAANKYQAESRRDGIGYNILSGLMDKGGDTPRNLSYNYDPIDDIKMDPVKVTGYDANSLRGDDTGYTIEDLTSKKTKVQAGSYNALYGDYGTTRKTEKERTEAREAAEYHLSEIQHLFLTKDELRTDRYLGNRKPYTTKDERGREILKEYQETIKRRRVNIPLINYSEIGEKGEALRKQVANDINTGRDTYTWYSRDKKRPLTNAEVKKLGDVSVYGEVNPESMITYLTGNENFANSYRVSDKNGNTYYVAKESSVQDNTPGKFINKIYTELNLTPGVGKTFPIYGKEVYIKPLVDQDFNTKGYSVVVNGKAIRDDKGEVASFESLKETLNNALNAK
jgi:hypothetical protein